MTDRGGFDLVHEWQKAVRSLGARIWAGSSA
jgi:hypothetical protein